MTTPAKTGRTVARAGQKTPAKTPDEQNPQLPQPLSDRGLTTITVPSSGDAARSALAGGTVLPAGAAATITALAALSRQPAVIAAALGLRHKQFLELLKVNEELAEAYEEGRSLARDTYIQKIQRGAFDNKTGKCRNVTLAIWLGKIVHGFHETSGQQSPVPVAAHFTFNMPAPVSVEDWRKSSVTVEVKEVPDVPGK